MKLIICKDIKIDILHPVSIDESNINKYNSSSDYYNDLCYPYTSENNTDITIKDRQNEFINNNWSLCEINCEYNGYDDETKYSHCECQVKISLPLISDIVINKDLLLNNFNISNYITNLYVMKCYRLLFSKEGLLVNISNYIILFIILVNIICFNVFIFKDYELLKIKIGKKIIFKKVLKKNFTFDIHHIKIKKEKKYNKNISTKEDINILMKNEKNIKNNNNNIINSKDLIVNNPPKAKSSPKKQQTLKRKKNDLTKIKINFIIILN